MPLTFRCEVEDTSTWRCGRTIQHLNTQWNPPPLKVQHWWKNICQNHAKTRKKTEKTHGRKEKTHGKTPTKTQLRFYPPHQQKTPKCGGNFHTKPPQFSPPEVSQALGTDLVFSRPRPSQTWRPPGGQQMSWRMKLKTVEPRKKKRPQFEKRQVAEYSFFSTIFVCPSLWNWCSNTSRYGRRFQRHIAQPSSWRTIYHTDLEKCRPESMLNRPMLHKPWEWWLLSA